MTEVNIRALAELARLEISDQEAARLERELPGIIDFVEEIQKADVSAEGEASALHNVMRDDANPHESGKYTETLLRAAPNRAGERIAVKQVISRQRKK